MTTDSEAGFTLLETIVAITILASALAIATQSIVLAGRSITSARNQAETALRIREQLAGLEASGTLDLSALKSGLDRSGKTNWKVQEVDIQGRKFMAIQIDENERQAGPSFLTFVPSRK
ncbi:type II secretion system protein [Mesorhizobium sp. 1M-11]|uniref:PulJ/GspJ family protein n=1 Tax=Mesorhizobium sp. 1M-11 TaxID=1529006 RepID=UPI0006C75A50|nr:type II secretion system protein [Mesorhizobium sp. 1M-11]